VPRRTFSGREVAKVLHGHGYTPTGSGGGSHRKFVYENPNTGEKRVVTVPMHDEIAVGTLKSIADQCGAENFREWCRWIDEHR